MIHSNADGLRRVSVIRATGISLSSGLYCSQAESRPTWLDLAHKRLDEAVFAAYGWKSDLSDEEILEKLLSLNLERSR